MADGKVVGCRIRGFHQLVRKRRVRVADDLRKAMVLHHDDEHVVEMTDALESRPFGGKQRARQNQSRKANDCCAFHGSHLQGSEFGQGVADLARWKASYQTGVLTAGWA